ncbi:MAG: hypothetical protein LBE35_06800 [Clostridiales bacterium]|nr:hypothetical protein [Clostridiales bacterium]
MKIGVIKAAARRALVATAQAICEDLKNSGTMPFESGHLQNSATYVDAGRIRDNKVAVVSDTVYARRKFFHPEFEFDQSVNRRAGGRWFDAYTTGDRRNLAAKAFAEAFKGDLK